MSKSSDASLGAFLKRNKIRLAFISLIVFFLIVGLINTYSLELTRVEVIIPDLPPALDGLVIGQISDIHSGYLMGSDTIRQGVESIMSGRPDLIVLTGDFVSGYTKILWTSYGGVKPEYLKNLDELANLQARLGVFAVLGNHDFWSGPENADRIIEALTRNGVQVLRNQSIRLEPNSGSFYLVGVDDYWNPTYSLKKAMSEVPKETFSLLLSHNPDVNEDIEAQDMEVDLVLSGHTHGGQIVLPFVGAPIMPSAFGQKYRAGLVRDGRRQTYINRGLGFFLAPLRLNCPPEVTLLTLRRGK